MDALGVENVKKICRNLKNLWYNKKRKKYIGDKNAKS